MGKNDNAIFWIIGIIIAVAFLWQGGYLNNLFSALSVQQLICSQYSSTSLSCSNYMGTVSLGTDGKINFVITKPSRVDEWVPLRNEMAKGSNSDYNSFFQTHTLASGPGTSLGEPSNSFGWYSPYDAGWDTKIGAGVGQYYSDFYWSIPWSISENIIQSQLITIEGTYVNEGNSNNGEDIKTYGICTGRGCWVYDPHPEQGYELWNNPTKTYGLINPTSIKISFKNGGYTEADAGLLFNQTQLITIYRLENNQCTEIEIKKLEKLSNDYDSLSECQTHITISCVPNWQVGNWDTCINNQQTRTVSDLNSCNNNSNKPTTNQSCTNPVNCTPSWQTGNWSNCFEDSQTRIVTDLNNCNVTSGKPITSQTCTIDCTPNCDNKCGGVDNVDNGCGGTCDDICKQTFFDKYKWIIIGLIIAAGVIIVLSKKN